jgi:hypothetical protein
MRLSVHLLSGGKFWEAGTEIPPEISVPGGALKYLIPEDQAEEESCPANRNHGSDLGPDTSPRKPCKGAVRYPESTGG